MSDTATMRGQVETFGFETMDHGIDYMALAEKCRIIAHHIETGQGPKDNLKGISEEQIADVRNAMANAISFLGMALANDF